MDDYELAKKDPDFQIGYLRKALERSEDELAAAQRQIKSLEAAIDSVDKAIERMGS